MWRIKTRVYQGVTDASGNFTVVYNPAFPVGMVPNVTPQLVPNSDANRQCRVTAASNTGFTVRAESRASVSVVGIGLALGFATTPVVGAAVQVTVTQP